MNFFALPLFELDVLQKLLIEYTFQSHVKPYFHVKGRIQIHRRT